MTLPLDDIADPVTLHREQNRKPTVTAYFITAGYREEAHNFLILTHPIDWLVERGPDWTLWWWREVYCTKEEFDAWYDKVND